MKKILIIASDNAQTAPGKVFNTYINQLRKNIDIDVIIANDIKKETIYDSLHPRIASLSINIFNLNVFDFSLAKNISRKILKKDYDVILSMMSSGNFLPLYVGSLVKKQNENIQWLNYCVDAIPPPKGWELSNLHRHSLKKMFRNQLKMCNKIYASNSVMLEYQLAILGRYYKGTHGVLFTLPDIEDFTQLNDSDTSSFNILYTGGLYQARKIDKLLIAIDYLVREGINIKLHLVGTNPLSVPFLSLNLSEDTVKSVVFHPYTSNLIGHYESADLLIDLDAEIKNDVFISSKFFNYIMVNRPVLCITSENSPVTKLIQDKSITDIYVSPHDSGEIYQYLKLLITSKDKKSDLIIRDNTFLLESVKSLMEDLYPSNIL